MSEPWVINDLPDAPHSIRPETHWRYKVDYAGGPLWFSLQLSPKRAAELRDAFTDGGDEGGFHALISAGARMARASHGALSLALEATPARERIGADILVPPAAFAELLKLAANHVIEITDAGLAIEDDQIDNTFREEPEKFRQRVARSAAGDDAAPTSDSGGNAVKDRPSDPVIIAIVDDAIGIANRRFRKAEKNTRIAHFLDLGPPCAGTYDPEPQVELLARSWTAEQINTLLDSDPNDDERVYRALGLIGRRDGRQPLRAAASHGTHMLDTAAGYDYQSTDEAERAALASRPIIAVQLPPQVPEDRSDAWLPQSLKRALDWILVKADELSAELSVGTGTPRRLPLIVSCSFGSMAGPKDGQGDLERRITQFVETYRGRGPEKLCTVVLSAGNFLLTRAAACVPPPGTAGKPLSWRMQPDDKTPNFVEIWGPETGVAEQQISVTLKPPRDAAGRSPPSRLNKAVDWTIGDVVYARLYHQILRRPKDKWRECITVAARATADDGDKQPVVPFGAWEIEIDAPKLPAPPKMDLSQYIHLRVHRDDPGMFAHGKGRQSYFDDPLYERFDPRTGATAADERRESDKRRRGASVSPVIMQGSLSAYAYAQGVLVVGGYRRSDGTPSAYSSSGAEGLGRRGSSLEGPDIAATTEESPALWGILGTGTYSGSVQVLNGTSVAAPLAVRALADEIAERGSVETLRNAVARFEASPSGPHKTYERAGERRLRFGAGRLPFRSSYRKRIEG